MFEHVKNIITHTTQVDKEILDLLEHTTIGTNGAKYKHLHTAKKIHELHKPHYFTIRKNKKAIGNMTVCERPMYVREKKIDSFYIRYFSFNQFFQSNGENPKKEKTSIFQKYLVALFNSSNLDPNQIDKEPSMFWAFIDPQNNRSWQMADRFNFETIGMFSTYGFSRFFPKLNKNVSQINANEIDLVWKKTKTFYNNHTNLSKVQLFKNNNYFVFRMDGNIVAGVQVFDIHWKIEAMPGTKGKIAVKTLPYVPLIRKIINPRSYHFVAAEGIFCEPGHEDKVQPLLESVLKLKQKNAMLFWIDNKDDKLKNIISKIDLGLLQKMKSDNDIEVLAKFNNFDNSLKQTIIDAPKYISAFDAT